MAKPPRRRPPRRPSEPFQPLRTLFQILCLQGIFYLSASLLILFTSVVSGRPFTPSLVLSWQSIRGDNAVGWSLGLVWVLTSLVMVIAQLLLIQRSKLVLDFSLTLHGIHLLVVSFYEAAIPTSWLWWGLQGVSTAVMVVGGTWACRWRELRPVFFGRAEEGQAGYEMVPTRAEEEG